MHEEKSDLKINISVKIKSILLEKMLVTHLVKVSRVVRKPGT
jgi:hypothetical protein